MNKFAKTLAAVTAAALMLTGCAEKKEQSLGVGESKPAETASAVSSAAESTGDTASVEENSSAVSEGEKPVSSSTTTTATAAETPVESKPDETSKPASSATTSSSISTTSSSTSSAASSTTTSSSKPVSSSTTSSAKPVEKPTPAPTHNCNTDGHVWGNSYTKTETETTTIEEVHDIAGNGYDYDLALRYFGRTTVDWSKIGIQGYTGTGSGSATVIATATKTTTKYFHDCTECGKSEIFDTTETTEPGTNWTFKHTQAKFNTIWYDINNVPPSVVEAIKKDMADQEDWLNQLISSGNW